MFNFFEQWINVIFAGCYDNVTGNIIYIYILTFGALLYKHISELFICNYNKINYDNSLDFFVFSN